MKTIGEEYCSQKSQNFAWGYQIVACDGEDENVMLYVLLVIVSFHMVWVGISMQARTELYLVHWGALNAKRYISDTLKHHVIPSEPFIGDNFIPMHDNARSDVAGIVTQYLNQVNIAHMAWPARSPNLNLIQHVWDMLDRRIWNCAPVRRTLYGLRRALLQKCENIPQNEIRHLFQGMPWRI